MQHSWPMITVLTQVHILSVKFAPAFPWEWISEEAVKYPSSTTAAAARGLFLTAAGFAAEL